MIDSEKDKIYIFDHATRGNLSETFDTDTPIRQSLAALPAPSLKRQKTFKLNIEYDKKYEIPDTWVWVKLGEISTFGDSQKKIKPEELDDKNIWLLELEDIDKGGKINTRRVLANSRTKGEKVQFFRGQLLYSKLRPYLKKNLIADENGIATPELIPVDILGGINPYYVLIYLMGSYVSSMINRRSYGIKMPRVDMNFMINLPVPLPPIEEQERIVKRVNAVVEQLTRLDNLQKQYANNISALNKKILGLAVQGKLVPQDPSDEPASVLLKKIAAEKQKLIQEGKIKKQKKLPAITKNEIPFEIPESWKWVRMKQVASIITDGEHSTPKRIKDFDGYYLLSARNVRDGYIQLDDVDYVDKDEYLRLAKRCNPKKGDVLISCSGSVGRCTVVEDNNNYVMVRSAAVISPIFCNPRYLMYAVQSECVQKQINSLKKQTAQANLFLGAISELIIPIPPIEEQNEIVEQLDILLQEVGNSFQKIQKVK